LRLAAEIFFSTQIQHYTVTPFNILDYPFCGRSVTSTI
jgi:hypothetical protein